MVCVSLLPAIFLTGSNWITWTKRKWWMFLVVGGGEKTLPKHLSVLLVFTCLYSQKEGRFLQPKE